MTTLDDYRDVPVANPTDYISSGEYNPHAVQPWVIGNEYGHLAVAYASNLHEALDYAADADLLRGLALDKETAEEREREYEGEGVMYLGNDGSPFDSLYAHARELPNVSPDHFALTEEQRAELTEMREGVR